MLTLFEMMQNAQSGELHQNLSRQFKLTQEQTEKALEALLPAFSQGLKRNTADPAGFASFMQALSGGQHSQYMDNPAQAFSPAGMQEGNAILSHLFGNKDVSRAVASQAAQVSGVGESILKQMLPALAPMILGGLSKQMRAGNSMTSNPGGGGQNPWGQIMEQMMGGALAKSGSSQQSGNPLEDLFGQMMGGGNKQAPDQASPMDNPLGKIFEEMLGGAGTRSTQPQSQNEPKARSKDGPTGGLGDLFGEMFDTGRQTQEKYQNELSSIFDQFLKSKR
ncbi:MAG: DUF937 domain-containing protein [Rhizobiaceae bacterium]